VGRPEAGDDVAGEGLGLAVPGEVDVPDGDGLAELGEGLTRGCVRAGTGDRVGLGAGVWLVPGDADPAGADTGRTSR
jgi:hypothetical protein